MKGILKLLVTLIPYAAATVMYAQQTKVVTPDNYNDYGLVYSLPTTAVRVDITARHTVRTAGPFHQLAKKYIGTGNVVGEDSEKWEIIDVKLSTYGVVEQGADTYRMQLKPGASTFISVYENGMLASINTEDAVIERNADAPLRNSTGSIMKRLRGDEYLSFVNEDFLAAQSLSRRAQILSENLMEVRESRIGLTRGTADNIPSDGKQLELMLSSLSEQETALVRAFTGSEQMETVTRSFSFVPDEEGRYILTRLSDFAGFVDSDDLRGEPVYITVEKTREGEVPVDDKGIPKSLPKDAVIYNIPGAARISISNGSGNFVTEECELAQYGMVFGLNPSLFTSKKDRSYAIFNPVTGNVSEIGPVTAK